MILRGESDRLQLGAFLMLLRVKEESAEELAGFVQACRESMLCPPASLHADLDWSSYAGKKHQHPWFLLSMLLLAQGGYRVFVHGSAGHTPGRLYTENAFVELGLPVARNWAEVSAQLRNQQLSYLSLEHFCPMLQELIQLRPLLGLRSPVNTLTRMLNPLGASASLQSIFHPAYARLHQETDVLLRQPNAMVFKGDSGEIEIKPHADTRVHLLYEGTSTQFPLQRSLPERAPPVDAPAVAPLRSLWRGESDDRYGLAAVLATTAAALLVLGPQRGWHAANAQAAELWRMRDASRLP